MFKGSNYAYYGMYLVGFAIMMAVNVINHEKYRIKKSKAVLYTLITYAFGVGGAMIMGSAYTRVMKNAGIKANSNVAIFGAVVFCPVFMLCLLFVAEKLFGAKKSCWRDVMDLLAPGIFIILTCAKFGCFMDGCCFGREWSWGIYKASIEATVFPVQIFEVGTMILVLLAGYFYTFRSGKFIRGTAYPFTAAVYSVTRFCWEFMRYYPSEEARHIMFGLTFWQFCCVIVFAVSVISIVLLKNVKEKPKQKKIVHKAR